MLLLLFSSLVCGAQNSISNFNTNLLTSDRTGFLQPVQETDAKASMLTWPEENGSSTVENEEFSSLLLGRQLTELDHSTPFSVIHHPTLERYIRVFLHQQKDRLERVMGRSEYYFPVIEKQLDKNDLPVELKYLAIVESALNPEAVSPSGARGMWQFMYGTGKEYGLHIDSYLDQRLDFMRSTQAACQYLKKLHDMFGNWDLALAAYNSGPGNVRKAIQRSGGKKDYWSIRKYLPTETRGYLPSFYATMYLFEYSAFHQLKAGSSDLRMMHTDTVHLKRALSLDVVERRLQLSPDLIEQLNPQYKKNWIPHSKGRVMSLTLPEAKVREFITMEDQLYRLSEESSSDNKTTSFIRINSKNSYLVQKGDNLNSIAKKHKISVTQLKKWNGMETNFLIAGQRLVVRDQVEEKQDIAEKEEFKIEKKDRPKKYDTYKVKPGDTLFRISRIFNNVSIAEIREWNQLEEVNHLQPGMVLKIVRTN